MSFVQGTDVAGVNVQFRGIDVYGHEVTSVALLQVHLVLKINAPTLLSHLFRFSFSGSRWAHSYLPSRLRSRSHRLPKERGISATPLGYTFPAIGRVTARIESEFRKPKRFSMGCDRSYLCAFCETFP